MRVTVEQQHAIAREITLEHAAELRAAGHSPETVERLTLHLWRDLQAEIAFG